MEAYKNGEVDEVNLVYTEFISALSQEPKIVKLLPVTIDNTNTEKEVKKAKLQFNIYLLLMQYLGMYYLSMYQEVYMEQ